MTTPTKTTEQIVKQAYIISAHAAVAAMGINVGDTVNVNNHYSNYENQVERDRYGTPLPAGHKCLPFGPDRTKTYQLYGSNVKFLGINDDGDAVVAGLNSGAPHRTLPYSFIRTIEGATKTSYRLNDQYEGTIFLDAATGAPKSTVAVGCQRFQISKLREFLAKFDKIDADSKAKKEKPAQISISENPTPTYVTPKNAKTPSPAKKAATKKAAPTKTVAKKATTRRTAK